MYRFIIFTIQIILLVIILTFLFSNPFIISLDIGNLKYSFTSNIFAILTLLFLLFFYVLVFLYFKSRFSVKKYLLNNKFKKLEKGYHYFVEAMIAVANKDNRSAIKFHKKMNVYLNEDPSLSLLLKSEVYKIDKNLNELSSVYETMIKSKKTEALGYRGLMELNLNNQDYHHAFLYGEKLFYLNPSIEKLYETLVYISAKTKNWNQLLVLSDKAYSKKIIDRETLYENKSIGHYEIAKIKFSSNSKDALKDIIKALEFKKNFPPFIKLHLEIISQLNNLFLLKKMIKKYWSINPNFLLRSIVSQIIIQNKLTDLSFIYQVIKNNREENDSKKLLVFFAIKNQEWKIARENISGLIGSNPSREICLFMADIELGEHNDKQKSDSWILRSENLAIENSWICRITNKTQEEWESLSNSGYFNSLVLFDSKMISSDLK